MKLKRLLKQLRLPTTKDLKQVRKKVRAVRPTPFNIVVGLVVLLDALIISGLPMIGNLAAAALLFLLPGYLLTGVLGLKVENRWARLLHIVGGSVAFTLLGGLLANTLKPLLGLDRPLGLPIVLPVLSSLLIGVAWWWAKVTKPKMPKFRLKRRSIPWRRFGLYAIPAIFPLLAIGGANTLNNGGGNWLTLTMIGLMVSYVLVLFAWRKQVPEPLWLSSIYAMGLALLFMTSMRAWHITGYDISQEFQVFMLTKDQLYWSMSYLQDPYNACLSITILPTVISQLMQISDEYVFKFVAQPLFALVPVGLYLFIRSFAAAKTAFLGAFFFVTQVWFFQGMPALVRQEFAMLFFMLLLMVLFSEQLSRGIKYRFALLYGAGMVLSHYSTTYVALALLLLVFCLNLLSRWTGRLYKPARQWAITKTITLPVLLIVLSILLVWNVGVTRTAGNISEFADTSVTNIGQLFGGETFMNAAKQLLYPEELENDFNIQATEKATEFREDWPMLTYYDNNTIATQPMVAEEFKGIEPALGGFVESAAATAFKLLKVLVNNVFIVVGVAATLWYWLRRRFWASEYTWLGIAGLVLLALLLLLPDALKEYNLDRLYFQLLIVWSLAAVGGGLVLLQFIKQTYVRTLVLAGMFCLQLLFYSGFIFQFAGGPALVSLNNRGEEYAKFYTHDSEVAAARWLGQHRGTELVYASSPGRNKLRAHGNVDPGRILTDTLPTTFTREGFVYQTYINTVEGKGLYLFQDEEYGYSYPQYFLDNNKNLLYSAGVSKVYK